MFRDKLQCTKHKPCVICEAPSTLSCFFFKAWERPGLCDKATTPGPVVWGSLRLRHTTLTTLCLWALIAGLVAFKSRAQFTSIHAENANSELRACRNTRMCWRCLSNCSFLVTPCSSGSLKEIHWLENTTTSKWKRRILMDSSSYWVEMPRFSIQIKNFLKVKMKSAFC